MADVICDERPLVFEDLVAWFSDGSKAKADWRIGAEHEKFPFYLKDHSPVPYEGPNGIHTLLILLLVALIPMHIGAALKHHFWNRHDVLIGMLPELKEDEPAETDPRHGLPGSQAPPAPMRG